MNPSPILPPPPELCGYYKFGQNYRLSRKAIFLFGSNLAGAHGKGAAKTAALYFDAAYGIGEGFTGRSYALPTKDKYIRSRRLSDVIKSIREFVSVSQMSALDPDYETKNWFYVTPVGTGLAGFTHEEIAPHFEGACNCWFPDIWEPYLGKAPGVYHDYRDEYISKYGWDPEELYAPTQ